MDGSLSMKATKIMCLENLTLYGMPRYTTSGISTSVGKLCTCVCGKMIPCIKCGRNIYNLSDKIIQTLVGTFIFAIIHPFVWDTSVQRPSDFYLNHVDPWTWCVTIIYFILYYS